MTKKYHEPKIQKEIIKYLVPKSLKDSLLIIAFCELNPKNWMQKQDFIFNLNGYILLNPIVLTGVGYPSDEWMRLCQYTSFKKRSMFSTIPRKPHIHYGFCASKFDDYEGVNWIRETARIGVYVMNSWV